MKAALKATLVFCGFPALIWVVVGFHEIAVWVLPGVVLVLGWLVLFVAFGGLDD